MKILKLEITEENYQRAIKANSGACLVADAIKEQYPELSDVKVDVATIRVTDRKAGERYIFLTPPSVGQTLIFFDQGWEEQKLPKKLRIKNLVRVLPIARSASMVKSDAEQRAKRLAKLQGKVQQGETLSSDEKRSLTRLENYKPAQRPTSYGPTTVEGEGDDILIRGGKPTEVIGKPSLLKKHPNMLAGRTRHFGAKVAQPNVVFEAAVKEAVLADRKSRRSAKSKEVA